MKFGLLLPHFGEHASREQIVGKAKAIEEMGFDSVWVRDHLIYSPHGMESADRTFFEPLLTLAAIGAVTERIRLGTAVLIPIRWPIKLAQNLASLDALAGTGRVIAGMGLGNTRMDFQATGLDSSQNEAILAETVDIARRLWTEDEVSYRGEVFQFADVTLSPKPKEPIPFVYGGTTRAAVRRAVTMMDGWVPGRIPLATLDARLTYLRELADAAEKKMFLGTIPLVVVHPDRDKARTGLTPKDLGVSSAGAKYWVKPQSGAFETLDDLEGLLIAGNVDDCVREISKLVDRNLDLVVLDLRLQFDRYWEQIELLAQYVIPEFAD